MLVEVARGSAFVVNCLQERCQLFCGFLNKVREKRETGLTAMWLGRKRQARYAFAPVLWKKLHATRRAPGGQQQGRGSLRSG